MRSTSIWAAVVTMKSGKLAFHQILEIKINCFQNCKNTLLHYGNLQCFLMRQIRYTIFGINFCVSLKGISIFEAEAKKYVYKFLKLNILKKKKFQKCWNSAFTFANRGCWKHLIHNIFWKINVLILSNLVKCCCIS